MSSHDIMTLEEVAAYLRVSERTVYDWAQKGTIPAGKLGTAWRFKRSEIERWVDERLTQKRRTAMPSSTPLRELLHPERILLLDVDTKEDALNELVNVLATAPEVKDREELRQEIFRREELMSTGIGFGVAVPHVRLNSIQDIVAAVGISRKDIADYASLDDKPVRILCMLAARVDQHAQYLKALGAISGLLRNEDVRNELLEAPTPADAYNLLTREEA